MKSRLGVTVYQKIISGSSVFYEDHPQACELRLRFHNNFKMNSNII